MNNNQLQRLLNLMRRTNDRTIVVDNKSDEMFVMMPIDKYEDLLDEASEFSPAELEDDDHFGDFEDENYDLAESWKDNTVPVPERDDYKNVEPQLNFDSDWDEPKADKADNILHEEKLDDVPHEEEEEKFYLEPVE